MRASARHFLSCRQLLTCLPRKVLLGSLGQHILYQPEACSFCSLFCSVAALHRLLSRRAVQVLKVGRVVIVAFEVLLQQSKLAVGPWRPCTSVAC